MTSTARPVAQASLNTTQAGGAALAVRNLGPLAGWMTDQGLGRGPLEQINAIGGGTQNVMLRFVRDGRTYVLRRGPVHLRPASNAAILREIRVLGALRATEVPHPRLIATCTDPTVLNGAVFYLMEPVEGFNASIELPAPHRHDAAMRHRMGLELTDALARLGSVDHVATGLGDFGRPAGFLERQVPRWLAELESYREVPGYPGAALPGVERVADWLVDHRPASFVPGIMHGDFHAANVMFSRAGPEVAAIVDWEMCTIGDPLLDLGWLLATWRLPGAPLEFGGELTNAGGLADAGEIADRYAARTGRHLTHLTWYTALACFKLGILLEGTLARASTGRAPRELGERLHTTAVELFTRAQNLVNGEQ